MLVLRLLLYLQPANVSIIRKQKVSSVKKILKKSAKVGLPLLLGGLILWWVYRDFDFQAARRVLVSDMRYGWMLLSLVFGVTGHLFRGWRWRQTLAPLGERPSAAVCVQAVLVSYAANLVVPRLGEVSRCGVLAKREGTSFSKALGTVVTERLVDSLCAALLTGLTLLLQLRVFERFFAGTGTRLGSVAAWLTSPYFYILAACFVGIGVLAYHLLRTLSFFARVKGMVRDVWEGVRSLRHVENKPLFALYTFLIWLSYFLHFYLTFFCFPFTEGLGLEAGLVLFVVGTIAVVVPTPNGAGPWHFAVISMMTLYGVSAEEAGIFALLVHGIQTFLLILLGIYGTMALSFSPKTKNL